MRAHRLINQVQEVPNSTGEKVLKMHVIDANGAGIRSVLGH